MTDPAELRERAKELRCLYRVDDVLSGRRQTPEAAFRRVLEVLPAGWQRPDRAGARLVYLGRSFVGPGFSATGRVMGEALLLFGVEVGRLEVSDASAADEVPTERVFLSEEVTLLRNVAGRLGEFLERKHAELFGTHAAPTDNHWAWRESYAEALAARLDRDRFGSCRVFLGGSTELGQAGPGSDIDLSILATGSEDQRRDLTAWLDGWSTCLAEIAERQTGHPFPDGLLNVEWIREAPSKGQRPDLREL